jgi:hypothetical protein
MLTFIELITLAIIKTLIVQSQAHYVKSDVLPIALVLKQADTLIHTEVCEYVHIVMQLISMMNSTLFQIILPLIFGSNITNNYYYIKPFSFKLIQLLSTPNVKQLRNRGMF